jgi:hypothetical protein
MVFLKEITEWKDNTPNHVYIFENKKSAKIIGYLPEGKRDVIWFEKPLSFDKSRRKFKEIKISG